MATRLWKPLLIASLLMPLAACQTVGTQDESGVAVEDRASTSGLDDASARARGLGGPGGGAAGSWRGKSIDDPSSPLSKRVIYFDYDSDAVRDEYRPVLEAHAAYLVEKGGQTTLEGHTDERGSREYNLGLGERRGQSVQRLMTVFGARSNQTRVISFGEERPEADGHDESAWAQNRRVEIVYGSR
jgi:peptidoglycan-associated lipoprotein